MTRRVHASDLIAVSAERAAKMLDLSVDRFHAYVRCGALPGPVRIGEDDRWPVARLVATLTGEMMDTGDLE